MVIRLVFEIMVAGSTEHCGNGKFEYLTTCRGPQFSKKKHERKGGDRNERSHSGRIIFMGIRSQKNNDRSNMDKRGNSSRAKVFRFQGVRVCLKER